MRALARAIDAKSKWTAGHSERVTELALMLGRQMGLGDDDMETLHRGGLLHDIGKIGVPADILDSPSVLSPAEREQVAEHPTIGARILEPIRAFSPVIPIVSSTTSAGTAAATRQGCAASRSIRSPASWRSPTPTTPSSHPARTAGRRAPTPACAPSGKGRAPSSTRMSPRPSSTGWPGRTSLPRILQDSA